MPLVDDGLWSRLEPVTIAGARTLGLSAGDLLMVLCVHGWKHLWERLSWIHDVAQLLATHGDALDWEEILGRADSMDATRALITGLVLARDVAGATLPPVVERRIAADPVATSLAEKAIGAIFANGGSAHGLVARTRFHMRSRRLRRNRASHVLGLVATVTPRDLIMVRLPPPLFPLHYLLRPVRLIAVHGQRLFHRGA